MMRTILLIAFLAVLGLGAWLFLREDGLLEQVTEARVAEALISNGVPPVMTQCMAPRLVDRLSISQLRALERAKRQAGESAIPLSTREAMARLERINDREAVEQLVIVAGGCGFELMLKRR